MPVIHFGNGQSMSVSNKRIRAIHKVILENPALTALDYANMIDVPVLYVNKVIESHPKLMELARQGQIAISPRCVIKPNWFLLLTEEEQNNVPRKKKQVVAGNQLVPVVSPEIEHPEIRKDTAEVMRWAAYLAQPRLTPTQRNKALKNIALRANNLGEFGQYAQSNLEEIDKRIDTRIRAALTHSKNEGIEKDSLYAVG